jgi:hypothetical protein
MGDEAVAAIFDSGVCVGIISAAGRTQSIKRTIAEQTVEVLRVFRFVTGEVFAFRVLKKRVAAFFRLGEGRVFFVHHILYLSFFMIPNRRASPGLRLQPCPLYTNGEILHLYISEIPGRNPGFVLPFARRRAFAKGIIAQRKIAPA